MDRLQVIPVRDLREAVAFLEGEIKSTWSKSISTKIVEQSYTEKIDMAEVKGQESVKHASEIAAAGGHNVLIVSHYPVPGLLYVSASFACL